MVMVYRRLPGQHVKLLQFHNALVQRSMFLIDQRETKNKLRKMIELYSFPLEYRRGDLYSIYRSFVCSPRLASKHRDISRRLEAAEAAEFAVFAN